MRGEGWQRKYKNLGFQHKNLACLLTAHTVEFVDHRHIQAVGFVHLTGFLLIHVHPVTCLASDSHYFAPCRLEFVVLSSCNLAFFVNLAREKLVDCLFIFCV